MTDRRALVVGLGRTGIAMARYLASVGARVRVCDRRSDARLPDELQGAVELCAGRDDASLAADVDLVIPSPGVPATSPLLTAAVARGVPVVSELELAADLARIPLVAITGTNGKSTTTELTGEMLRRAGRKVFVGGNLGTPLITAVGAGFEIAVVEVSSFQLEWVDTFHPIVGALLNVTDDHLDRHGSIESYAAVKARLFARQTASDTAVLNRDDRMVRAIEPELAAKVRTFGGGPDDGLGAMPSGDGIAIREAEGTLEFSLARSSLIGAHNRENIMASLLCARAAGAGAEPLQAAIDGFAGLRHRMELVHEKNGVRYLDDSKGTNVGALLRSLEGLPDGRVVLIAGGLAKGGDFSVARSGLARKTRFVALYGSARAILEESWRGASEISSHEKFADAVQSAAERAKPGDVVLLSPACASMDQFTDYAQRGDVFASLVRSL